MPFPILAFVAAGVTAVATVAAWAFNQLTQHERELQEKEYSRRKQMYSAIGEIQLNKNKGTERILARAAKETRATSLGIIKEHRKKIGVISEGLTKLFSVVNREVVANYTSPYRRSVLRREYCRLEDASTRLSEYEKYLDYEASLIDTLYKQRSFQSLIERDPPQALLPVEWLYPGKLLIASMDEIGISQPNFGHTLRWARDAAKQKALALAYGEEFPILITDRWKRNEHVFFGCVARGTLFYDHIMCLRPVEFVVEKAYQNMAILTFGDSLVKAMLPREKMNDQAVVKLPGQNVSAYPEFFDLRFLRNPFSVSQKAHASERKSTLLPEVSELSPDQRRGVFSRSVFAQVDDQLVAGSDINLDSLFDNSPWQFLHIDEVEKRLVFGKHKVRLYCLPAKDTSHLEVKKIEHTEAVAIGCDLPMKLVLVGSSLQAVEFIAWPRGTKELIGACYQMNAEDERAIRRKAEMDLFLQWSEVLDYQFAHEQSSTVNFLAPIVPVDGVSVVTVPRAEASLPAGKGLPTMLDLLGGLQDNDFHDKDPGQYFALEVWDEARQVYLKLPSDTRFHVEEDPSGIQLTFGKSKPLSKLLSHIGGENQWENVEFRWRATFSRPNVSVIRQRDALLDFMNDRVRSQSLKEALVLPREAKRPRPDLIRFSSDNLSPSQAEAVRTALSSESLSLIQGPPGTGKTTVIVELLKSIYETTPDARVLLVSQQNVAVDTALARFIDGQSGSEKWLTRVIRVGNEEKMMKEVQWASFDSVAQSFFSVLSAAAVEVIERRSLPRIKTVKKLNQHLARLQAGERSGDSFVAQEDEITQSELYSMLFSDKQLVAATCVGLGSKKAAIDRLEFDVCIVDEAGRATLPELLIPLVRSKKAILIGDHHQLPPSIAALLREDHSVEQLPFIKKAFFEESFFEKLFDALPNDTKSVLRDQYRMSSAIGDLVADLFYSKDGRRGLMNGRGDDLETALLDERIHWVDVDSEHTKKPGHTSLYNNKEAEAIISFLTWLAGVVERPVDVAVITPYSAQKLRIRNAMQSLDLGQLSVKVDTVDSFQGSEADIVCYSIVRTHGSMQFLLDKKRLNVACSRAREHLLFFGSDRFVKRNKSRDNLFSRILPRCSFKPPKSVGKKHSVFQLPDTKAGGRSRPSERLELGTSSRKPDCAG